MAQMIDAMVKIRAASEGTAQIIRDINEIAFQTNLLALNAAVEAARAGDAGRGFAVVAEEVRYLAQRAKEAAKKTEDLINESVSLADSGGQISQEVSGNLTEILTSVSKVAEIVAEVATASQEQSRGIEQVNAAVAEMDKVVQAAAANAEESSSAAEELASQAQELAAMVGRFHLAGKDRQPAAAAAGRAPTKGRQPEKRPAKSVERRPAPARAAGWQLKPEDIIPLDDELELSKF
jgi:methyl-accepting chemotaxis protein